MSRPLALGEKPLYWVGSSKRDLMAFLEVVRDDIGAALGVAQFGGRHPSVKPLKGLGAGILEVVGDAAEGTFRAVYTVRFPRAIYVLHAVQKKATSGIATSRRDIALTERRLKDAQEDYKGRYGAATQ